jgi:hypothetical protein
MGAALAHAIREIRKLTVKRVRIELAPVVHLAKQIADELAGPQNKKSGYHHLARRRPRVQHPRQIDPSNIFSTRASSLSMAASVPSSGPFIA